MRKIYNLYTVQGTMLTEIDMLSCTIKDIYLYSSRTAASLSLKYFIVVDGIEDKSKRFVDLSSLVTMTNLVFNTNLDLITWEQVGEKITDHMVLGYSEAVPDFTDAIRGVANVQILSTPDFEMFYTTVKTPEDRNVKFRRWQLVDLGVTKVNKKHPIQLENSLLSINGLISRPIIFNKELLMPLGAQFMHSSSSTKQPSVNLLDFSGLGNVQYIPFSECSTKFKGDQIAMGTDIQMFLPDNISLTGKSVLLVLAHSLFFPESFRIISDKSIKISPHLLPLGTCLLKQKIASYQYNDGTDVVSTDDTLQQYISEEMFSPTHHGAFFIIIDTPTLYIKRDHAYSHADSQLQVSQTGVEGFLWDKSSCSIFEHVRVGYTSLTDFYSRPAFSLHHLTASDYFNRHHAVEELHPFYHPYLHNSNETDMYLVQIIRP